MTVVRAARTCGPRTRPPAPRPQAIFKNGAVYIERYLDRSRHTEIQLVCDTLGNGVHFGERDCSVQRRHQKLIEEAPSIHVDDAKRADLGGTAVDGALSIGYTGAGTMEFLLDDDGKFWFMEMNTRIQVEHPVTEAVTSVDLIKEQIRVAGGEPLERVAGRGRAARPRDRVPHQRRGPRAQLHAVGGPPRALQRARRAVDARGLPLLPGLDGQPVLRLADRQAHRVGQGPRGGHGPHAARPLGVRHPRGLA